MNAKLFFKTVFALIVLLLLLLIGKNNSGTVTFSLPPILPHTIKQSGGIMYFAFFAIGVLVGTILTAGSGGSSKKGSGSAAPKPARKDK